MAALKTVLWHGVVIFLVILLMFNSENEDPLKYEANSTGKSIEGFLKRKPLFVSDINIDYTNKSSYNKHKLANRLRSMHFKQLVDFITRPIS